MSQRQAPSRGAGKRKKEKKKIKKAVGERIIRERKKQMIKREKRGESKAALGPGPTLRILLLSRLGSSCCSSVRSAVLFTCAISSRRLRCADGILTVECTHRETMARPARGPGEAGAEQLRRHIPRVALEVEVGNAAIPRHCRLENVAALAVELTSHKRQLWASKRRRTQGQAWRHHHAPRKAAWRLVTTDQRARCRPRGRCRSPAPLLP